jgi:hypothetical protein
MRNYVASSIATASLILAVAAYYPSAGAFTPAILLSFVAAGGALATAYFGFVRIAMVTLLVVAGTVLISPIFFPSFAEPNAVRAMLGSAICIAIVGFFLLWDFRRRRASARTPLQRVAQLEPYAQRRACDATGVGK